MRTSRAILRALRRDGAATANSLCERLALSSHELRAGLAELVAHDRVATELTRQGEVLVLLVVQTREVA